MGISENSKLSDEDESILRESLKRCRPEVIEAAIAYRINEDISQISIIVEGIAERFLEPEIRPLLNSGNENLRIFEDLGIDSLTMVEVVILIEETLQISIENEELKDLRTIADVNTFIHAKVQGLPAPEKARTITGEEIIDKMPHQPPFLFLQEATLKGNEAQGIYKISGDEYFLEGHFKSNPVFPASIMIESLGQLGVLFLLTSSNPDIEKVVDPSSIYFTSCNGVRVQRICKPGDMLRLSIKPKRIRYPLAIFEGHITTNSEKVSFVEEFSLTFDYKKQAS